MEVTIKKSSMVGPATETPTHHIWLSPLDLQMMRSKHSAFVYFYKSNISSDSFKPQVLKDALSNVLVPFYPAAGRYGRDENGRIEIICNAEGALFVEAEASIMLDDLDYFAPNVNFDQLFPFIDYSKDISSYPLVLIQVTRFKCGGMSLGVRTHHTLVDGPSAVHFLTRWCDMAKGNKSIDVPPFLDRAIMKSLMPHAPTFHHTEFLNPPPSLSVPISSSVPSSTSISVLRVGSEEQLDKLKALSNKNGKRYTTYCILAAHLWRCVTKARCLPDDQVTKLALPIDGRPKLMNPPLPPGYFGNVVFLASAFSKAGDLLSESFANTVERIQAALNKHDDTYMKSTLACLENLLSDPSSFLYREGQYDSPNLVITKLSRLPVHQMDFGFGPPIFLGRAVSFEGQVHMLPPLADDYSGDHAFSLITSLKKTHMELYQKLVYENPVF